MSLIKMAFWACVVVMLIPVGHGGGDVGEDAGEQAGRAEPSLATQAFGAARLAVSDMISICDRNPQVCETGALAFDRFREKAVAAAGALYRTIADPGPADPDAPRTVPARATPAEAAPQGPAQRGRDTLKPADLDVPWQGPRAGDA